MLTLETCSFRVWEITCVLQGNNLVEKMPRNRIRWIGRGLSSSSLNQQHFQAEVENLKATEENLDRLIRSCSEQLFDLTDDEDNAAYPLTSVLVSLTFPCTLAYVTPGDLCRIEAFWQQEVMVLKAPDGTSLKIPAPTEDSIQLHLKGRKGPIQVLTCDIRVGDSMAEESGRFLTVEESRSKRSAPHKDSEDSSLLVLQSGNPRQPVEPPSSNEEESNQPERSQRRETPEQDAEDQTIQGEERPFLEGTFITVFTEEPFDPELKEREPTSSQEEKAPYEEEEPSNPEPQTEEMELCGGTCEAKTEVSAAPYTPQDEEFQALYKEEPSDPEPQKEEKELCGGTSEVKTDVSTAPYQPQDEKFQALYKEEPSDPETQKEEKGVESTDHGPDSAQRGDGGSFDEDDTHDPAPCSDRSNWDEDAEPPADDTAASSPERTNPEPQPVNCTELEDEDSTNSGELGIDGDALTDSEPGSDHESITSQTRSLVTTNTTTKSSSTEGATIEIVLTPMESSCTQKNYSYVCKTPQSKIAHHLRNHEKKDPDIAQAFALPKHSKERKLLFKKLRNRGNFEHNKEAMINRAGPVKIRRRPERSNIALNSKMYVHCAYCKAMLMRKLLGRHLTRCPSRTGSEPEATVQPEPESTYSRPISPAVLKILGNSRDEVASVARNDFLLLLLTQSLLDKHGGDPSKFEYIRQKVQEMSRLLLNLRRKYSISSFEDAVKP
ncbi:uncharacterized protein LOC132985357 [Labrus mixtus]|uniref:uncharacterized protein LOC132985357 n=1 Tax=Labrus mixtus TaxID=508554 RepID=UPI0029C00138|nr:uncharacterized protein LOC132985357 [Labrus mixtus]